MPLFWDFLIAPWRVFSFVLAAARPVDALANGTPSPGGPGLFCSPELVGDQTLHVCHVFGYSMPSFVFWAAILIFALFVASSLALLIQCHALAHSLTQVASQLDNHPHPRDRSLTLAELAAVSEILLKDEKAARPWRRFEETLLLPHAGAGPDAEIFAPLAIESVFDRQTLIDENVQSAFFSAVPGILTGVGLLMTFVAILDGLSHVSVSAAMDVQGIGGLINGLSGKFVSSVVAVSCAVAFVFVERLAYSRPTEAYRRLVAGLRVRFRRRTAEHLLYQIQNQLSAQAEAQAGFAKTLHRIEHGAKS